MSIPLKLAVVAGEESGDLLAADLVQNFWTKYEGEVTLCGVGDAHLQALGLESLFDGAEIALMGISAIVKKLPRLVSLIDKTAQHIVAQNPDCLVIVDNPEFTHRVAKKVRAADPSIPIVNYVCPSVWAWRPKRAQAMRGYIDHVLSILPFEGAELERLDGPPATYVGHRLTSDPDILDVRAMQTKKTASDRLQEVLFLPGSRRGEVSRLMADFAKTAEELQERGFDGRFTIAATEQRAEMVAEAVADWTIEPQVVVGAEQKWQAFGRADVALAASGTVALELALCQVPFVSVYRLDGAARATRKLISGQIRFLPNLIVGWSASLPNLIVDWPLVPEYFDMDIRPRQLARHLERLGADTAERAAQRAGFAHLSDLMQTKRPAGDLAAQTVLDVIAASKSR